MVSIRFNTFGGMRPAISGKALPAQNALLAHNTRLTDGSLRAFHAPKLVAQGDDVRDMFLPPEADGQCKAMLLFDECVSVVVTSVEACAGFSLLAVFPDNDDPYLRAYDEATRYPLGITAPLNGLTAQVSEAGSTTFAGPDPVSYTYTWVDRFGIESAPAPASAPIQRADDATTQLSGFSVPPANAAQCRIYRTGAKMEQAGAAAQALTFDTTFVLLDIVAAGSVAAGYTDDKRLSAALFDTLETTAQCLAPIGLRGVVALDTGYYVGFSGNVLHVSARHRVWDWPAGQQVVLPDRITGIAESGGMVYVATTGAPARVALQLTNDTLAGEQTLTLLADVVRSRQMLPGLSQRSICATPFGAVYVAEGGLVALAAEGDATVVTVQRIGAEPWAQYAPSRIIWHDGCIYGISPHKPAGLRFELGAGDNLSLGDFVTIDMQGSALHAGRDGVLYYLHDNKVYAWDKGDTLLPYVWRSRITVAPGLIALTAGKMTATFDGPVQLRVLKEDAYGTMRTSFTRPVRTGEPFRITPGKKVTAYALEVRGTATITELHAATSIAELSEGD